MKYFIFALPRSRSAWLSVFLGCYHELTAEPDWRNRQVNGAVDTGAFRNPAEVYRAFPSARYFSLYRDPLEINASAQKLGSSFDATTKTLPEHQRIEAARLSDLDYLEQLWARIHGTPFDRDRAALLTEMNIQRDIVKFSKRL